MTTPLSVKFDRISYANFLRGIRGASRDVDDLSIPLNEIANRFQESRKFIFDKKRKGPGSYDDLSPRYKNVKRRKHRFIYPILRATGRLGRSLTKKGGESIREVGPRSLTMGTTVPYAQPLQEGTSFMRARPFLFWGPESPEHATGELGDKLSRSIATTLFTYIEREMGQSLDAAVSRAERRVDNLFS